MSKWTEQYDLLEHFVENNKEKKHKKAIQHDDVMQWKRFPRY